MFGLNQYAGSLAEDIRLEETDYTIAELEMATAYYRDQANEFSQQVQRDSQGNVDFADFETLAANAGKGFEIPTYEHHYPVFAGSRLPVKKLC